MSEYATAKAEFPGQNRISDGLPPEVQRKIVDAFETFDHEHNKTVDAREERNILG